MMKIELTISNDAAKAVQSEITHFLSFETKKLTGDLRDRDDTAALGYVILRQLLAKVTAHNAQNEEEERAEQRERLRRSTPTVRERRGVHA
jgi:hypothetical protein